VTEVRHAGPQDAGVMAALRYAFRTELEAPAEPRPQFIGRTTTWLAERLEAGSWAGWLAHDRNEPVGLVLVHLVEKVPNPVVEPESLGYVSSLYVRPRSRGRGVGDALLRTAIEFCRGHGVDTVVLWPSPRSIPLYQRHGFRRQGEVMELHWAAWNSPELRQDGKPVSSPGPGSDPTLV
jgi:GNAT superfamily N-acetyltransferase